MYLLSVCDHTQRSQPSALFRIVFIAFFVPTQCRIPMVIRIGFSNIFSSASSLPAVVVCILFNNNRETIC